MSMLARSSARTLAARSRTAVQQNATVAGRRQASIETRDGKSKLIYRIGLKDIPVELYPLGFVVGMGLIGGVAVMHDRNLKLRRQNGSPQINNPTH